MRMAALGLVTALAVVGCSSGDGDPAGGSGGTGGPYVPTTYVLFDNDAGSMPAGRGFEGGPFTLSRAGSVEYTITNRSTTTPDHWDVGIMPMSEKAFFENGQPWNAYAVNSNVSTISDGENVPAGTYYIVLVCDNLIEDCQFSIDASMTF